MEPKNLKALVLGAVNATFDTWADVATKASDGKSKSIAAIRGMQNSVLNSTATVDARLYAEGQFVNFHVNLTQVFHLKVTHPVSRFSGGLEPLCC